MKFVSLHGHSSFSAHDGHGSPKDHIERVAELGMSALALTEHGSTSSHVQLEKAAVKAGIKPIFGCEIYLAEPKVRPKFHHTVLAMNEDGYRQLNRLVTRSWDEGHYYSPTVHPEWLLDPELTSGLITLSGCADSWLSCILAGGKSLGPRWETDMEGWEAFMSLEDRVQEATALAERFQEVYGDRYYLEVQRFPNYNRTRFLNSLIRGISLELGIPMVASADVHYPKPEDWEIQRLSNAIGWKRAVNQLAEDRDYEASPATFPLSDEEIIEDLQMTGLFHDEAVSAVEMTAEIAERCTVVLPKTAPVRFSGSDGTDEGAKKLLLQSVVRGVALRKETSEEFALDYEARTDEYKERIKKELATILPKHFSDYFLINEQMINWAKDQGIAVGPGRGSAAGSLICYLLRITEINPMMFPDMVFERFLDPGREDDPDIDTDYQDDRRDEVFEYARSIYGRDSVGNIGNFSRFRGKTAIKTSAKALGVAFMDAENFAEHIVDTPFGDPREFHTAEDAANGFEDAAAIIEKHPDLELAYRLEGDFRTLGIHAAGMVISNRPISDTCAVYRREKTDGEVVELIAYDKRDAEYLSLLKLDFLGLLTMTIIAEAVAFIEKPEMSLTQLYNMPRNDPKVFKAFAEDDLTGIFQFEGRTTRQVVRDIFSNTDKSPDFMMLADINALSRPGSLVSGMTKQYIAVERGEEPKLIHPVVDEILKGTNGCLVYQEQVMRIGTHFGGLSDHEIGSLRKIIGAKESGGAFEAFWVKFRDGAARLHGAPEAKAREVWDYMAASATYLFNVAHAVSYAVLAYWSMYLKVYHPTEFYVASLRVATRKSKPKGKPHPSLAILKDAVQHGLTVSPPHPYKSSVSWDPTKDMTGLQAGFLQLPGVGEVTSGNLVEAAKTAKITKWEDFIGKASGFGPKSAENATNFCASPDPFEISLTNDAVYTVVTAIADGHVGLDMPDADSASIPSQQGQEVTYVGHVVAVKIIDVIGEERIRNNLTTEEVVSSMKRPELSTKAKIICADIGGTEVHVTVSRYNYPDLKEDIEEIETDKTYAIHVHGQADNGFGPAIRANDITTIELER